VDGLGHDAETARHESHDDLEGGQKDGRHHRCEGHPPLFDIPERG
jgi:hypothetical protein